MTPRYWRVLFANATEAWLSERTFNRLVDAQRVVAAYRNMGLVATVWGEP